MILGALNDYYQRRQALPDPAQRLPAPGLEDKELPFIVEIDAEGTLVRLHDTRTAEGKKRVARRFLVPQAVKRASNIAANLLWDAVEYALGIDTRGKPERVVEQHAAFRARIAALGVADDTGLAALNRFLDRLGDAGCRARLEAEPAWPAACASNAFISFRLHGDLDLICQRPAVAAAILAAGAGGDAIALQPCLVSGEPDEPERLHAAIKGVWGAQTAGANIVSFNLEAFNSYGKAQGANAPVGKRVAFAYTTALNALLAKGSPNRFQVGDASAVCWSEKPETDEDSFLADLFGEHDDPDRGARRVRALFNAVQDGQIADADGDTRHYVLGLAPNAARIAVRFFIGGTLAELAPRLRQHFTDLAIVRPPHEPEFPSLFRLLAACAVQGKADNIPPRLGGDIVLAALAGPDALYPAAWFNAAVVRSRAERDVGARRAAAIKACLNRQIRRSASAEKEFLPMLDPANPNVAYRLGRLFAALEKIQEEASPGLNATIRDRYFGAASSAPVTVFTALLRLKNAHLRKLPPGRVISFERLLGEVLGGIADFPAHLALPDQGRFALGYYHQRQAFFTRSNESACEQENPQ